MPPLLPFRQVERSNAFAEPRLQALLAISRGRVQPMVDVSYGAYGLLIGADPEYLPSVPSPMAAICLAVSEHGALRGSLRGCADALPLPSDSMALVVLQHALHGDHAPALLVEAARVLAPEGVVLVVGINSLSLWNLWRRRWLPSGPGVSQCRRLLAAEDIDTLQVRRFGPLLPGRRGTMATGLADVDGWLSPGRASFLLIGRKRRLQSMPLRLARSGPGRAVSPGLAGSFRKAG